MVIDTSSAVRKWMPDQTLASIACSAISALVAKFRVSPAAPEVIVRSRVLLPLRRCSVVLTAPTTEHRPLGQSGYGGVPILGVQPGTAVVSSSPSMSALRIAVIGLHHMYWSLPFHTVMARSEEHTSELQSPCRLV